MQPIEFFRIEENQGGVMCPHVPTLFCTPSDFTYAPFVGGPMVAGTIGKTTHVVGWNILECTHPEISSYPREDTNLFYIRTHTASRLNPELIASGERRRVQHFLWATMDAGVKTDLFPLGAVPRLRQGRKLALQLMLPKLVSILPIPAHQRIAHLATLQQQGITA